MGAIPLLVPPAAGPKPPLLARRCPNASQATPPARPCPPYATSEAGQRERERDGREWEIETPPCNPGASRLCGLRLGTRRPTRHLRCLGGQEGDDDGYTTPLAARASRFPSGLPCLIGGIAPLPRKLPRRGRLCMFVPSPLFSGHTDLGGALECGDSSHSLWCPLGTLLLSRVTLCLT